MRTSQLGLLVLLAAILSVGVWYALDMGDSQAFEGEIAGGAGLRPEIADLPIRKPGGATDAEGTEADGGREALASAPEAIDTETDATPDEDAPLLVGRVVAPDGRPVAGARVWAVTGHSWVLAPLDVEKGGLSNWLEPQQVETDDEGRFAFAEGLEPGTLRLAVRVSGFGPLYVEGRQLSDRRPHDVGDLTLAPGVRLEGKVVDRRGDGVEDALILQSVERGLAGMRISMPGRGVPLGRTGAEGRFVLDSVADGPWSVIVDAEGYQIYEERGRTAAAGDVETGLLFVLERGETIHGKIRELPPDLHGRLRVEARPKGAGSGRGNEGEEGADSASRRVRRSFVDADGGFRIDGLHPQTEYTLTVWEREDDDGSSAGADAEWKRQRSIESAAAWAGARVELEYGPESSIAFRVIDAGSGEAVESFIVWAGLGDRLRPQESRGEDESALRRYPDGRGSFDGLRPGRDGARAKLLIRATGYKDLERGNIAVARGEVVELGDLALERAPEARVTALDDATGEPVEGAHVLLAKEDDTSLRWFLNDPSREAWGSRGMRFGITDASGRAGVPLIEGEWGKLHVVSDGYVASEPLDVPPRSTDDIEHTVRLMRGGAVIVTVRSPAGVPIADAKVEHRMEGAEPDPQQNWRGGQEGTATDPEGIARFEHLKPGSYSFRVMDDGEGNLGVIFNNRSSQPAEDEGWRTVSVVEGGTEELDLVGTARASLRGILTESRVGLAGANLNLREKGGQQRYFYGGADKYQALSEYDGRFAFNDISAGEYTLVVTHGERRMTYTEELTLAPGENVLDVELPLAILEGRVVDPDGTPIPGLEVRVDTMVRDRSGSGGSGSITLVEDDQGSLRPDWRSSRRRRARTAADGTYVLRGVTTSKKLRVSVSGNYVVTGTVEDIVVAPDEIRGGVDFVLERAGRLEVRLEGAARQQYNVEARMTRGEGSESPETFTRNTRVWGSRTARIGPCLPGTWQLTLKVRVEQEWQVVASTSAEVRAGESLPVTIEVP